MPNDVLHRNVAVRAEDPGLSLRRRRLKVRCRARGTKELCVLLDRFLSRFEGELDEGMISELEELMLESDDDILAWICAADSRPGRHGNALKRIRIASTWTGREDGIR